MDNRIKELVARFKQTTPTAPPAEQADAFDRDLEQIWKLSGQYKKKAIPDFSTEKNLAQLKQRIQADKQSAAPKIRRLSGLQIAAAIVFLISSVWLINQFISPRDQVQWAENNSSQYLEMVLEDGSEVQLFPGARMSYSKSFKRQATRAISISGKAHFSVRHKPEQPFIIQTPNTVIKVLGTQFMIEESEIETTVTVEEGKVAFTDKTTSKMIQLTANEVGVFQAGGVLFQEQTEVQPGPQVIQLRKETLARLVAQLGRRHDWTITLDDAIQTCTITGEFDLNQPQATLNKIMELGYQIKKKTANQYQITGVCK